jgi:hypothetical protein
MFSNCFDVFLNKKYFKKQRSPHFQARKKNKNMTGKKNCLRELLKWIFNFLNKKYSVCLES